VTLTFDPNINRGHLFAKSNAPTKFEDYDIQSLKFAGLTILLKLIMIVRHIFKNNFTEKDLIFLWISNTLFIHSLYIIKDNIPCFCLNLKYFQYALSTRLS
jgi:hypothetical protein